MPVLIRILAIVMLLAAAGLGPARPLARGGAGGATGPEPTGYRIDLNRADEAELRLLPGIGPVAARRIVQHRLDEPFEHVQQLERIHRIGPVTVENVTPYVVPGPAAAPEGGGG